MKASARAISVPSTRICADTFCCTLIVSLIAAHYTPSRPRRVAFLVLRADSALLLVPVWEMFIRAKTVYMCSTKWVGAPRRKSSARCW